MSAETPHPTVADILEASILEGLRTPGRSGLFVFGLCGPQGSGKSTVASELETRLGRRGLRIASLSLDDLYLGREERARLARTIHPLLRTRGPPGTHDVALGLAVIDRLERGLPTRLPRFDKGGDERRPEDEWPQLEGGLDILLLEGWCVGARPQADGELAEPVNALERLQDPDGRWRRHVNTALAGDYQRLFGRLDHLALLAIPDFDRVVVWRTEQERTNRERLARAGRPAPFLMDDAEVAAFVQVYQRLTCHVMREMRARADVVIDLDARRRVTA